MLAGKRLACAVTCIVLWFRFAGLTLGWCFCYLGCEFVCGYCY